MKPLLLSLDAYRRAVSLRDLTNPAHGPHAMQELIRLATEALCRRWRCEQRTTHANPVVPIEDNYDRLHYPPGAVARDVRYTRYVSERLLLRTHTSAMIPPLLKELASTPVRDVLLVCPGLVYRRDSIDRLHTGEPHQLDLWRVRQGRCTASDLCDMVATVVEALLPGRGYRTLPAEHPYTTGGLQIDVRADDAWVEIGECGLALPALLEDGGLSRAGYSGLAMGLGLDRILMSRKGIDDIRLLRSTDPRVARQMLDLGAYVAVSRNPAARRDLSIAVGIGVGVEELGDRVRNALGADARKVEEIVVVSETPAEALPAVARERLGMQEEQKNLLVRVTLRDLDATLTSEQANELRDRIYAALHEGNVHHWAARPIDVGRRY